MKQALQNLIRFLVTLSITFTVSTQSYSEPPNLGLIKQEVRTYYDSGQYQHALAKVINSAEHYISHKALANQHGRQNRKLVLVLDIDETSLSNYKNISKHDFSGDHKLIYKDILAANAPAIKPTLALYNAALQEGIKVYFITGRRESLRKATQSNLHRAGYKNWSGLYMRPENYTDKSIIPFKSQSRAAISAKGYTIIANIGDQYSDLKGGYAQKAYKLPNPFYYLP